MEKRITSLSDELAGYAFSMFHGGAHRRGAPYPAKHYRFGVRTPHALHLTLNVRQTAGIIAPHLAWVVSEPVREVLDPLPRVKLLPTEIEKVFDLPMRIEDEVYREDTDADPGLAGRLKEAHSPRCP